MPVGGRTASPAVRFNPIPWIDPALSGSASDRLLVEQALAAGTDFSLDVIGNPASLPDSVDGDRVVLVAFEGHSLSSGY
jgi:hypothetical protein